MRGVIFWKRWNTKFLLAGLLHVSFIALIFALLFAASLRYSPWG